MDVGGPLSGNGCGVVHRNTYNFYFFVRFALFIQSVLDN
jgi:hypothetical protein